MRVQLRDVPLFAVQQCSSGRWLVRAPNADPFSGGGAQVVAAVDEWEYVPSDFPCLWGSNWQQFGPSARLTLRGQQRVLKLITT
jgi:hypothetical protein